MTAKVVNIFGDEALLQVGYVTMEGEEKHVAAIVKYLNSDVLEIRDEVVATLYHDGEDVDEITYAILGRMQ